jgi:UDP-3-O-[3-hydroxymyristoyl] N-acetylglucosamine deacetylase
VLDAIGDLALAGGPLLATYRSVRGGHKLNHAVLCALMSDASAWTWMEPEAYRPVRGYAELPGRLAPVFGPDIS